MCYSPGDNTVVNDSAVTGFKGCGTISWGFHYSIYRVEALGALNWSGVQLKSPTIRNGGAWVGATVPIALKNSSIASGCSGPGLA